MAASTLDNLARAYIDLVALNRQGAVSEARLVYQRIAHDLRVAIEGTWAEAVSQQAAGDPYAALLSLTRVLSIHRQNLIHLELSVTKAAVFTEMSRVLVSKRCSVATPSAASSRSEPTTVKATATRRAWPIGAGAGSISSRSSAPI